MSSAEDWLCPNCVATVKRKVDEKRRAEELQKAVVKVVAPPPLTFVVRKGAMLCPGCHKPSEDLGAGKFRCDPCDKWFEY